MDQVTNADFLLFIVFYTLVGLGFSKGYSRADDINQPGERFFMALLWPIISPILVICANWEKEII